MEHRHRGAREDLLCRRQPGLCLQTAGSDANADRTDRSAVPQHWDAEDTSSAERTSHRLPVFQVGELDVPLGQVFAALAVPAFLLLSR